MKATLVSLRSRYGLSQEDLAGFLGCSRGLLGNVEKNRRGLPPATHKALNHLLEALVQPHPPVEGQGLAPSESWLRNQRYRLHRLRRQIAALEERLHQMHHQQYLLSYLEVRPSLSSSQLRWIAARKTLLNTSLRPANWQRLATLQTQAASLEFALNLWGSRKGD